MVSYIVSRVIVVGLGTLYPAYRSYKAIKSKDTKEYVKWMMYWIVFAIFTTAEIFIDTIIGFWLPFYYEIKILFLFWILSPTTKGSSILYKKFVHPFFTQHEKEIDSYIEHAKEHGYGKLVQYGKKGLDLAADTMMKTAISGQDVLVQQLRRYRSESSLDGLGQPDGPGEPVPDEVDAAPSDRVEKRKSKEKTVQPVDTATETVRTREPTQPTRTSEQASTNLTNHGRSHAASMDDVYMRSAMTSDSSLLYESASRRYYDNTDPSLRNRPSSYYEGASTLPRNFTTSSYADYSTRPYDTSNLPSTDYTSSSYHYESSTLPRARDSSRRYNTRSGRY